MTEHSEDHNQLIWRYATDEELTSEELGLIEERQQSCPECASELAALERQREDERRRREEADRPGGGKLWFLLAVVVLVVLVWFFFLR